MWGPQAGGPYGPGAWPTAGAAPTWQGRGEQLARHTYKGSIQPHGATLGKTTPPSPLRSCLQLLLRLLASNRSGAVSLSSPSFSVPHLRRSAGAERLLPAGLQRKDDGLSRWVHAPALSSGSGPSILSWRTQARHGQGRQAAAPAVHTAVSDGFFLSSSDSPQKYSPAAAGRVALLRPVSSIRDRACNLALTTSALLIDWLGWFRPAVFFRSCSDPSFISDDDSVCRLLINSSEKKIASRFECLPNRLLAHVHRPLCSYFSAPSLLHFPCCVAPSLLSQAQLGRSVQQQLPRVRQSHHQ